MSDNHDESMGDAFQRKRAEAAARKDSNANNPDASETSKKDYPPEQQQKQQRRGGGGYGRQRSVNYEDMPLEQGSICALKESFGFIYCADRPEELFFHFSEVVGCHPEDLQIDTELSFRVGPASVRGNSNNNNSQQQQKMSAYQVQKLPAGERIQWEVEESPGVRVRGVVERTARPDRGGGNYSGNNANSNNLGSIRLFSAEEEALFKEQQEASSSSETKEASQEQPPPNATGKVIRYSMSALQSGSSGAGSSDGANGRGGVFKGGSNGSNMQLRRGDVIECDVVTERRTGLTFAKSIELIQSQQQRTRMEREQQLLQNATREEGIIVYLKNDHGFIRSNKRKDDVYFHFSNLILPEDDNDFVLREGQEMKFWVVTEEPTLSNSKMTSGKCSARQLECLPKGTVMFHRVIATGVTGVVTLAPHPPSNYNPSANMPAALASFASPSNGSDERNGTVRLDQPLHVTFEDEEEGVDNASRKEVVVRDVSIHYSVAPGGIFSYQQRGSNIVGLWVQDGDKLLFDVVQDFVEGSYHVAPTSTSLLYALMAPSPTTVTIRNTSGDDASENKVVTKDENAKVRLLDLSLVGRAEGVIHTIKDGYGFILQADRPVDVHFKFYDMLPDELQSDLRKKIVFHDNNLDGSIASQRGSIGIKQLKLEVGSSVQFDISLQGTVSSNSRNKYHRGKANHGGHNERENLKAQRVLLLPHSHSVPLEKILALNVKAVVKSQDSKQIYAGYIDIVPDADEENGESGQKLLREPMSLEERHPLVAAMIDSFLKESSSPEEGCRKSLVFREVLSMKDEEVIMEMIQEKADGILTCSHIPVAGMAPHPGRLCIRRIDDAKKAENGKKEDRSEENNISDGDAGKSEDEAAAKNKKDKSKNKSSNHSKGLRFDKSSLVEEFKTDIPPGVGDIVRCDVIWCRRTKKISVRNMSIIERTKREILVNEANSGGTSDSSATSGLGVIKEIVPNRNFGFISVLDETATKREQLFFHLNNSLSAAENKNNNQKKPHQFRKGDEVKFDIGTEGKNGKRIAINVQVLPKGTIPSKAAKNACLGYILMDPSHTSLSDTPIRKLHSSVSTGSDKSGNSLGGRWNTNTPSSSAATAAPKEIVEEGYILLLEDKTGMFKIRGSNSKKNQHQTIANDALTDDELDQEEANKDENSGEGEKASSCALFTHLPYKNGAIAIQGSGSSSSMDGSSNPRRGDLVSFVKAKSGRGVRDVRVVTRQAATLIRGRLENILLSSDDAIKGTAKFIATDGEKEYHVSLDEVVSCDVALLKEKQAVEGVLHEDKIYGICRTMDLYLESKLGASHKERPKLNLAVKKDRGGTIIAQSMMAKGPDGTNGFASGWTKRASIYATVGK